MKSPDNEKMGLFSCVVLIIGSCIGSAIFSISGITIWYAGPSAIVSWFIAAAIYFLFGLVVTGLALRYPQSGGLYVFPRCSMGGRRGEFFGFISAWGNIISTILAIGFSSIFLGIFLKVGFPSIGNPLALSLVSLVLANAILISGLRSSRVVHNTLVILILAMIVCYCGVALVSGSFDISNFNDFFVKGAKGGGGFISAVPLAMVAYGGSIFVSYMAADVKNPGRNIRLSFFLGLGAVALIYIALIATIIGTLPFDILAENESVRYIPVFASITSGSLVGFPWLLKVVSLCGAVALFSSIIAMMRVCSKNIQAVSAAGLLPAMFSKQDKKGILGVSILFLTLCGMALCFFSDHVDVMLTLGAVLSIVTITITCISEMFARRKAALFPLSVTVLLWACFVPDILRGSFEMWNFTVFIYAVGLVVYALCRKFVRVKMTGTVVHCKGRGHLHGMPTANLEPYAGQPLPGYGVWATRVRIGDKVYNGVTNVGLRPSDDDNRMPSVETMILDFDEDIYDREMTLEFVKFLRRTMKFDNLDQLRLQIDKDVEQARKVL